MNLNDKCSLCVFVQLLILTNFNIHFLHTDSDSDDGLFDGLDLEPVRKKMGLNQDLENGA